MASLEVEGKDEVVRPSVADVDVGDPDVDQGGVLARLDGDTGQLDSRFEGAQGPLHVVLDRSPGRNRVRLHEVPTQPASPGRSHDARAWLGVEDERDRLAHLFGTFRVSQRSRFRYHRESPAPSKIGEARHRITTSAGSSSVS